MKSSLPDLSGAVVMLADPGSLTLIDRVLAQRPAEVVTPDWVLVVTDFKGETVRGITNEDGQIILPGPQQTRETVA